MSDYREEIEKTIVMEDLWPSFQNPENIKELTRLSTEVYTNASMEGLLASILIDQQVAEEMLRVLLKDCQLMIKISLADNAEIRFAEQKATNFGRLIDELKKTISFEQKESFILECIELNKIRIQVVHGLGKTTDLTSIQELAERGKKHFEKLNVLYQEAHLKFCSFFKSEQEILHFDYQVSQMQDDRGI